MPDSRKEKNRDNHSNMPSMQRIVLVAAGAVLLFWILNSMFASFTGMETVDYSLFREQLKSGNVTQMTVQGEKIQGNFKTAVELGANGEKAPQVTEFITFLPSFGDDRLLRLAEEKGVKLTTRPEAETSWFWLFLLPLLPFILIFGMGYFQMRRMKGDGSPFGGGFMQMTKCRARKFERTEEATKFHDVGGAESAKVELQEIVSFLQNPEKLQRLGGEVPRGVLLMGPPGTGKTLLARAVAGEAEVPFFSITGSDFMEMFVGVGASRVRNMFEEAKKQAPSIIFIDELDSIGRRRGAGLGGGHDEREQTLNQLLSELDGFEPNQSVIVMAATNRPDILDPALLRPGRFDRRIIVPLPTTRGRLNILKIYAQSKPLADDVDLERLARGTTGFSGADLENLLQEAALLAARRDHQEIRRDDIEQARDKVLLGLERRGLSLDEEELRCIAYHEAGHAIVAAVLPNADPVHKVSILPRSKALGVTQQLPEKEKYIYRREYMLDRLAVMMGGRSAEIMAMGTSTSGAGNDLQEATRLARRMVLEWGMSEKFKNMALGGGTEEVFLGQEIAGRREYSETTAREIDEEIHAILQEAYKKAVKTLQEEREELDRLADILLEEGEIPGNRVFEVLDMKPQES